MRQLKGINLGGWLMMEGYIIGGRNIPEQVFKAELARLYGPDFVQEFTSRFREAFITDQDLAQIKKLGFNCVRLPFNYRLLEEPGGLEYLKQVVQRIKQAGLKVVLDMHAVPGAQNPDWHADCHGAPQFWQDKKCREKYFKLWQKLAQTFKDEPAVAGYDIMNEPVTDNLALLKQVFQKVIDTIRQTGAEQTIFLEGHDWGANVDFIADLKGDNLALSVHFYQPIEFTFNWLADTQYPGEVCAKHWDKKELEKILSRYSKFAEKLKMPVLVGEWGVTSRCVCCGHEFKWVEDALSLFDKYGFGWTYWTYKAVRGMKFPDGLYQLSDNSGILGNPANGAGMENFYKILKDRREEFFKLWDTSNFKLNQKLHQVIGPRS